MILEEDLQELFYDLHESGLFADGKTISDAMLLRPAATILQAYRSERLTVDFDLRAFFDANFETVAIGETGYETEAGITVESHIDRLWEVLTRHPDSAVKISSRIPLPYPYIVPGGRFDEIYYWDSYFTMLGLRQAGRINMIRHMIDNFAWMLTTYGLIPNGNRTYYLGRSQPPFFACMVQMLAEIEGDHIYGKYKPALEQEYAFWMQDSDTITAGQSRLRVTYSHGHLVNRYYDNVLQPRTEMYSDDAELIASGGQSLVTDIRAACESGWDFSSRWLRDQQSLEQIRTTEVVPVDLQCLLYNLERVLKKCFELAKETQQAQYYGRLAESRAAYIREHMYDGREGFFYDVDGPTGASTGVLSLATVYPLYFGLASPVQAAAVSDVLEVQLLKAGGLVTTTYNTGQQWDSPNGWAPLQWLAYSGLRRYGYHKLAQTLSRRWLSLNDKVFAATGKLMEKYNVVDTSLPSGGGEYPVQDGFGWTNGVYLAMKAAEHSVT